MKNNFQCTAICQDSVLQYCLNFQDASFQDFNFISWNLTDRFGYFLEASPQTQVFSSRGSADNYILHQNLNMWALRQIHFTPTMQTGTTDQMQHLIVAFDLHLHVYQTDIPYLFSIKMVVSICMEIDLPYSLFQPNKFAFSL